MIVYLYNKYNYYFKYIKLNYLPRIGETIQFRHNDFNRRKKIIDIIHNEDSTIDIVLDYEDSTIARVLDYEGV